VNSARSFVVSTLERWRAPLVIGDAVHLVEEMVASAVRTTGVADPNVQWRTLTHLELLTVTLVGLRNSIGMEVWDNAPSWPAQPVNEPALDRELLEVLKTRGRPVGHHAVRSWESRMGSTTHLRAR
jgi:hypothetical protein